MCKNTSTKHLFLLRTYQMGNPRVFEAGGYDPQGNVVPDKGNNRRMRRLVKAQLRKEGKL